MNLQRERLSRLPYCPSCGLTTSDMCASTASKAIPKSCSYNAADLASTADALGLVSLTFCVYALNLGIDGKMQVVF